MAKPVSRRTVVAGAAAAVPALGSLSLAGEPPAGRDPVLDLIAAFRFGLNQQLQITDKIDEIVHDLVPVLWWTWEELRDHGLKFNECAAPRNVNLSEIEEADRSERPGKLKYEFGDASLTWSVEPPPPDKIQAWRDRCAARRALFDAKHAAYDQARAEAGIPEMQARHDAAEDAATQAVEQIIATPPRTLAGVVAVLRFYSEQAEQFDSVEPAELGLWDRTFLSALNSLEGMVPRG